MQWRTEVSISLHHPHEARKALKSPLPQIPTNQNYTFCFNSRVKKRCAKLLGSSWGINIWQSKMAVTHRCRRNWLVRPLPTKRRGWSRWYIRQRCLGKAWLVHRGNCKKSMAMALNKKCGFTSPWCTCFLEKLSKWTVVAYPLCQLENIGPKVSWNPRKLDIFCCCRCPSPGIFPNQFPDAYGLSWHGRSKNFLSISSWSQAKVVNQLT